MESFKDLDKELKEISIYVPKISKINAKEEEKVHLFKDVIDRLQKLKEKIDKRIENLKWYRNLSIVAGVTTITFAFRSLVSYTAFWGLITTGMINISHIRCF
eukprot:gene7682-12148_t